MLHRLVILSYINDKLYATEITLKNVKFNVFSKIFVNSKIFQFPEDIKKEEDIRYLLSKINASKYRNYSIIYGVNKLNIVLFLFIVNTMIDINSYDVFEFEPLICISYQRLMEYTKSKIYNKRFIKSSVYKELESHIKTLYENNLYNVSDVIIEAQHDHYTKEGKHIHWFNNASVKEVFNSYRDFPYDFYKEFTTSFAPKTHEECIDLTMTALFNVILEQRKDYDNSHKCAITLFKISNDHPLLMNIGSVDGIYCREKIKIENLPLYDEITSLKHTIYEIETKCELMEARYEESEARNKELEASYAEMKIKFEESEARNKELEARNAEMKAEIKDLKAEIAELRELIKNK